MVYKYRVIKYSGFEVEVVSVHHRLGCAVEVVRKGLKGEDGEYQIQERTSKGYKYLDVDFETGEIKEEVVFLCEPHHSKVMGAGKQAQLN